ncbi:dihydrofolate reductase family protein [Saccharomonospora halophila]|uniref:dihydrofolate reductase family protein n=1 Tax=Saccharomonospora halophila TaxID=129922 RepID=UPI000686215C|nr:dihydrofolate reductase family protein [Saccharomonospora halophila]
MALTGFVTLDGVSQGPGSPDEHTSDGFTRGGWLVPHIDGMFVERTSDGLDPADGLLLGRRTYQAFARDWPEITDPDDPFTERMNTLPKYDVSNTLTEGTWHPRPLLTGDPGRTVAELEARPGRELRIHGSALLANALLRAGLIDTDRLVVAPTVLGTGRRLLPGADTSAGSRLIHHDATRNGLLLLEYETTGYAHHGEYDGVTAFARRAGRPHRSAAVTVLAT